MENQKELEPNQEPCRPRPAWQVWAARVALVIFIGFVIWQAIQIAMAPL